MTKIAPENISTDLITIGVNERIETAYKRMQEKSVRHLPVLTETGEVIGIISDRDVQRAMVSTIEHEVLSKGATETIVFDPETHVKDYMSWPVETAEQNTDIRRIAERMVKEKISSFLVSKGNKIIGIVTTEDLLKILIELLNHPQARSPWTLGHIIENTFSHLNNILV